MRARFAFAGALLLTCWIAQAHATPLDETMQEARSLLARIGPDSKLEEDRFIALAFKLAGGCPATLDGDPDTPTRKARKRTIDALIGVVAESGSKRGLTKLLQLSSCGIESPLWGREYILEREMARMVAVVPCPPPLPGEVAAQREQLAEFPILRVRKGVLRAELPTRQELDDLAYFMVAVAEAGEEVGVRDEGASWRRPGPPNAVRGEVFASLAAAKSAGKVVEVERLARTYLESLGFPEPLHGAEEDAFFWHAPRYHHVMRDLAESWEALGRYREAAGLWRRNNSAGADSEGDGDQLWQEQVKAVLRDEEIDGRCSAAAAERLLDVGGSRWNRNDPYGPKRLVDASFDVARLLRGALLTINRDAGEAAVTKAIDAWPEIPRLFARMRFRDKGVEDWERRLQAMRGLADTMAAAAIPLLLQAAEDSLPAGRQRAISAMGDQVERPLFDPCRNVMAGAIGNASGWVRPITPMGYTCATEPGIRARNHLARAIGVYASDRDRGTRETVAHALGKIAAPSARPVLRRLLHDVERTGTVCAHAPEAAREHCRPLYPVRAAARGALDRITEIEKNWGGSR